MRRHLKNGCRGRVLGQDIGSWWQLLPEAPADVLAKPNGFTADANQEICRSTKLKSFARAKKRARKK